MPDNSQDGSIISIPEFLKRAEGYVQNPYELFCDQNKNLLGRYHEEDELDTKKSDITRENLNSIVRFEYSYGGYFEGFDRFIIYGEDNKYYLAELPSGIANNKKNPFVCELPYEFAIRFFQGIYDKTQIFDWEQYYDDNTVCDGDEWEISFEFDNGDRVGKYGHMMWPDSFSKDIGYLKRYFGKLKSKRDNILSEEIMEAYHQ